MIKDVCLLNAGRCIFVLSIVLMLKHVKVRVAKASNEHAHNNCLKLRNLSLIIAFLFCWYIE